MAQNISKEEQKKICAMFFYLQDISLELQVCSNILNQAAIKLKTEGKVDIISLASLARMVFNYTVINVFKVGELIEKNQGFIKTYFPKSIEGLNGFRKKFYTEDLKAYRSKYVAHHLDTDTNSFLSREELLKLMCSILEINNANEMIEGLVKYMSNFYGKSNYSKEDIDTLSYLIHNLSLEISDDLKIELKRS